MARTASTFAVAVVLTALSMALGIAVARHGYGFGTVGIKRLDDLANATMFLPLAAIYFLGVALLMVLPLRAAAFVLVSGVEPVYWATVVLFAVIVGCVIAKAGFGQTGALSALPDWRFAFVAAIVACHALLNTLRRNLLLRTLALTVCIGAVVACLFWSFRL